jgi:hypothetical protein
LGKILYFDQQGLDHFIIVQPQSLSPVFVRVQRIPLNSSSFGQKHSAVMNDLKIFTSDCGCTIMKWSSPCWSKYKILPNEWSQEKFHQHMPNGDFKEFIIQVLVHLDILVEPKHYRQEKESKAQSYLVPCIVKSGLPVNDFYVKSKDIWHVLMEFLLWPQFEEILFSDFSCLRKSTKDTSQFLILWPETLSCDEWS